MVIELIATHNTRTLMARLRDRASFITRAKIVTYGIIKEYRNIAPMYSSSWTWINEITTEYAIDRMNRRNTTPPDIFMSLYDLNNMITQIATNHVNVGKIGDKLRRTCKQNMDTDAKIAISFWFLTNT
ncbi:hypothetical protein GCM10011491_32730 [Brucella endophytica]|uniref:Uncharacterized protein n=1 Tax=Brucella endophytica TaxID=1963359 RepID=A0A916WJ19_9HYPH|nr:hypothetical protein GCM10011491_32730 [Brucella endophytica]